MATRIYFGEAGANQTELSQWVPGPVPVNLSGGVFGAGTLAGKNTVTYGTGDVANFGTLAGKNTATWGTDIAGTPAFTSFATLSQITQSNVSTYIGAAAITSAHIGTLTADKLAAGNLSTATYLSAGNEAVVLDGRFGGRIYVKDPRTGNNRVFAGHMANVDYGFWLWDYNGVEIFGSSGLTGTYIKDATVGTLKIGANQITVPVGTTLAGSVNGSNTIVTVMSLSVTLAQAGKLLVSASLGQTYPSGTRSFTAYIYINGNLVTQRNAGTGSYNEAPSLIAALDVAAGTHTVQCRWKGQDAAIVLDGGAMFALGAMR